MTNEVKIILGVVLLVLCVAAYVVWLRQSIVSLRHTIDALQQDKALAAAISKQAKDEENAKQDELDYAATRDLFLKANPSPGPAQTGNITTTRNVPGSNKSS